MPVLVDTNILLRLLQPHDPHCRMAEDALKSLRGGNQVLNVAPQNIVEFWVVMTRPIHENGLGLTIEQAVSELEAVKRFFDLLPEISVLERC